MVPPFRPAGSLLVLLFFLVGCGVGPRVVLNEKVEGTLKMDDQPVPNVVVQFWPQLGPEHNAPSSSAMTDEKGFYQLMCENGKPGAVIAKHKVVITPGRSGGASPDDEKPAAGPRKAGPVIPANYKIASKTPLEVEITEKVSTYNLVIKR
jgi:hypothetical protein